MYQLISDCLTLVITKSIIKIVKQDTKTTWLNIYTLDIDNQIYEKKRLIMEIIYIIT